MAVDPQQMALAQSIAQFGSAGKQQMQQQQAQAATPKQQTLDDVAARAGVVNAPDAFLKQAAAQSGKVFDNAASSAANNSAALHSYMGSLNGAQGNYMAQLQAAVPLAQAEVDKAASGQNLNQMIQLLNLKQQQEQFGLTHDAAAQQKAIADNQKSVMNKILMNPDPGIQKGALAIISSNASQTLPEALAALSTDDGKKQLQKLGLKDDTGLRQVLTEYYSDPATYAALQSAQAAAQKPTMPTPDTAVSSGGNPIHDWLSRYAQSLGHL